MRFFKKGHPKIPAGKIEESWSFFEGEHNGKPLFARANLALKPYIGHPEYQHQIGVAMPFNSPDEHGFPSAQESLELNQIEDMLCAKLEDDNQSLFAAVITTGGMREFVFYTRNPQSVKVKLREVTQTVKKPRDTSDDS
jgi:hypothetical protein